MTPRGLVHVVRPGALGALLALVVACGGGGGGSKPTPPPPPPPLAPLVLEPGAAYFSVGGKGSDGGKEEFLASRNIAGRSVAEVESLLDKASKEGTRVVRFHLTHLGGFGITNQGEVDEAWAANWEKIFDRANADGIYVIPVFAVWADWNGGTDLWDNWKSNPLNQANGGPGASPLDLFSAESAVQQAWLGWLGKLVARFGKHANVAAWDVFSEVDIAGAPGGVTLAANVMGFLRAAAAVVRTADASHRPVTASTSWLKAWDPPALYTSDAIDVLQFHMYTPGGDLDAGLLGAGQWLHSLALDKPILIGESGLDYRGPDGSTATTAAEGPRATRHAVWAGLVAGIMNGRALWWEDGYDLQQNNDQAAVDFVTGYPAVEAPALAFLGGQDLSGLSPLALGPPATMVGGAIGNDQTVLAWIRSAACALTAGWDCSTKVSGSVDLDVPGTGLSWQATFYDGATGAVLQAPVSLTRTPGEALRVSLPSFSDDVAIKLVAVP